MLPNCVDGRQPALGLHVELELLVVADRPGADAADRRLHALRADRCDDVRRRQIEAGQALRVEPDPHRIVQLGEQRGLADARRARNRIQHVDDGVVGDEKRILRAVVAVEHDELQHGRGFLLHDEALRLHLRRQLGERALHAVVDVDGVDVGVGAERERNGQRVAAVIAAGRLHVEHLVDADDLGFERLGDAGFHHVGGGARKIRGDRHLRRHDVGKLRDRDLQQRQRAGDRDDERDDDGQPRAVDKDG